MFQGITGGNTLNSLTFIETTVSGGLKKPDSDCKLLFHGADAWLLR